MGQNKPGLIISISVLLGLTVAGLGVNFVFAEEDVASEINSIKREIDGKNSNAALIRQRMKAYEEKIREKEAEAATLQGEMDLLDNRALKTELDIQATQQEIEAVNAEIRLVDKNITVIEKKLEEQRLIMVTILREIQANDTELPLKLVFGSGSFSQVFDELQYLANVNDDLTKALAAAKKENEALVKNRTEQEGKKARFLALEKSLERSRDLLLEEQTAKESLLTQTQQSEAQFSALLYQLKQEQAYINQQIAMLQDEIEAKLSESDASGGSSLLSWPVSTAYRGISATFHDPTYPYRHLYEHPGVDVPEPVGTPIKSAAPGYVAWTKLGASYGNYVMVIHANGLATLYAHLSKFNVKADQFVARGEVIGYTGGAPGAAGAGLSTGPHLHFEVRKKGIPVNPLNYLTQ